MTQPTEGPEAKDGDKPKEDGASRDKPGIDWQRTGANAGFIGLLALIACLIFAYLLIDSGRVCVIENVASGNVSGIKACDVPAQVAKLIKDSEYEEVAEVSNVIAANPKAAKQALAIHFAKDRAGYLKTIVDSDVDPKAIESELKPGGFYSRESRQMTRDFGEEIQAIIGTEETGEASNSDSRQVLSSEEYQKARDKVSKSALLDSLRESADERIGPFSPLGTLIQATKPARNRPSECMVNVKDERLAGQWLRIENRRGDTLVRFARKGISGNGVTTDMHINHEDAKSLNYRDLANNKLDVYVRQASQDDLDLVESKCEALSETQGSTSIFG